MCLFNVGLLNVKHKTKAMVVLLSEKVIHIFRMFESAVSRRYRLCILLNHGQHSSS